MALHGVLTHRKTRRLAILLGVDPWAAMGALEALWHVTSQQQPDGGIGRLSNQDIADEMFHTGNADQLIEAFIESDWLDRSDESHRLYVHDWHVSCDDSTKVKLARRGRRFANGVIPDMRRLSERERERCIALYSDSEQPKAPSVRTKAHKSALPVPEPVPAPVPEPVPEPEYELTSDSEPCPSGNGREERSRNSRTPRKQQLESEFEADWPFFWARVGKRAARDAYVKARSKIERQGLLDRVKVQGALIMRRASETGSTPVYPATWLNQERWTDDPGVYQISRNGEHSKPPAQEQRLVVGFDRQSVLR